MKRQRSAAWLFFSLLLLLNGCASFEAQSDWRWQQLNPNYRPIGPQHP